MCGPQSAGFGMTLAGNRYVNALRFRQQSCRAVTELSRPQAECLLSKAIDQVGDPDPHEQKSITP